MSFNYIRPLLALLDWDETLRKGITLFPWIEVLLDHELFSAAAYASIGQTYTQFRDGQLTYEQFALEISNEYALGLQKQSSFQVDLVAREFVARDCINLFPFVSSLIELFRERGMFSCVISGCPAILLNHYIAYLGIDIAHGLQVECDQQGVYTGRVETNPALADFKDYLAGKLDDRYRIVVGLGNTASDLPLVRRAECGFIVSGERLDFEPAVRERLQFVEPDQVLAAVKRCLNG